MLSAAEIRKVEQRLHEVREKIASAAARAGRSAEVIQIVGITKSHPQEYVRAAHRAGLRHIGENRVEEALSKRAATDDLDDLRWHMVGHIQRRKARSVVQVFDVVHSVDRLKLAHKLNREAEEIGVRLPVMLECNVSGEASKWGWPLSDKESWVGVVPEFSTIFELPHLEVTGLMTMAPMVVDPESVRPVFKRLNALRDYLQDVIPASLDALSMGMTDDYEIAVEEGATSLRIGRAIFGPRSTT